MTSIIRPQKAPVRPRVTSWTSGESVWLHDAVAPLLHASGGAVALIGPAGSGKSTALMHLASLIPPDRRVTLLDEPDDAELDAATRRGPIIYARSTPSPAGHEAVYNLSPWDTDDVLEYLLAVHRDRCASVMERYRKAPDAALAAGNPQLLAIVLDRMACDESVRDVRSALRRELDALLPDERLRRAAGLACLEELGIGDHDPSHRLADVLRSGKPKEAPGPGAQRIPPFEGILRLARHRPVQIALAVERIVDEVAWNSAAPFVDSVWPPDLTKEAGAALASDPSAKDRLLGLLSSRGQCAQPAIVALLCAADPAWVPEAPGPRFLAGAQLAGVRWSGVGLTKTALAAAHLENADLREACLDQIEAHHAHFEGATLNGASMFEADLAHACLTGADLSLVRAEGANFCWARADRTSFERALLRQANFCRASLRGARFARADLTAAPLICAAIEDADFTGANMEGARLSRLPLRRACFSGARFVRTHLQGCDLAGMSLPGATFEGARLDGAVLAGSQMPRANFRNACLRNVGLADIRWAGANLFYADLRGVSFGSASPRGEPFNRRPEEIRKADLRGADLRGARIDGVDFHLVDLREALYTPDQEEHFRQCGAILDTRRT